MIQGTITIREVRRTMAQTIAAAKLEQGARGRLPRGKALAMGAREPESPEEY
ncbi:MAG TPA: hypothetical protein VHA54_03285 [Solirubrobacterales bacterium]|nr:hypothetical protein [Solirubrobacterales bacterium]